MTESDWFACTDTKPMLVFLRDEDKTSERKLRLFAVACCRSIWEVFINPECTNAVAVAERFADGLATNAERLSAEKAVLEARDEVDLLLDGWGAASFAAGCVAFQAAEQASDYAIRECARLLTERAIPNLTDCINNPAISSAVRARFRREQEIQTSLLRDIIGYPSHQMEINTAWNTSTVTNLATIAYENRVLPSGELDTARLAILADALEEAGCDNGEILGHLRGKGLHVRGCHVVDLLLGKE